LYGTQRDVLDNVPKTIINHKRTIMRSTRNIHEIMKGGAQRRDLFLFKTDDRSYRTEEWFVIRKLNIL